MNIIKRSGIEVEFNRSNIYNAVQRANLTSNVDNRMDDDIINSIVNFVEKHCKKCGRAIHVEEIQDLVEDRIMKLGFYNIARNYIKYRHDKEMARRSNTTDSQILSIIENVNEEVKQENSNKNPTIASVQRDYMAGEVSKDVCKRILLPKDVVQAHEAGLIHFHDMDYFAQHIYNCFIGYQKFVTDQGIKRFDAFNDGQHVKVKDMYGNFKDATVHYYGKRAMNKVTFIYRGGNKSKTKEVICTPDHRWILQDGTVTTSLKVGDCLYNNNADIFDINSIQSFDDAKYFCIGFILGDGFDNNNFSTVRLCGKKVRYSNIFKLAGFNELKSYENGDKAFATKAFLKQDILNGKSWKILTANQKRLLFLGYYAADGRESENSLSISTTDDRLAEMILDISSIAGYPISSYSEDIRSTNFKENVKFNNFKFYKKPKYSYGWRVSKIELYRKGELKDCWCVEEPTTHSFTLDDGIVTGNCCLVSLDDMLQNGTVISNVMIEKPHSFSTACNIAMQIVAQVASSQYGGQSISIAHLAPFVDISRQKIKREILEICGGCEKDETKLNEIVEKRLANEIRQGVQCLNFQCFTIWSSNGQTPFVTFFMYLNEAKSEQEKHDLALIIEEILKQRIQGVKNNQGVWVSPAFPKLIYVLEEDNCSEGTKYWPLTELAAKCTAKRLVPDYISEKKMMEAKIDEKGKGHCFAPMGCRSMLSPYTEHVSVSDDGTVWTEMVNNGELVIEDENTQIIKPTKKYTVKAKAMNGTTKDFFVEVAEKHSDGSIKLYLYKTFFYSRFNQGVVTLNLVDVALSANKNLKSFWKILDARLELCHKALRCRHERLMGTTSDIAPILWQYGAIARLKPGEKINKLLHATYSTISLGYAGLWECVLALIDKKLTEEEGMALGLEIMKKLNEATEKWKVAEDIGYGIYGTPLESTTYRFAKCLQKRFGIVKDVTDHGYITNSYHVNVREPIDAFTKLDNEAKFQLLSTGGAISYVEVPNMQNNIEAVLAIIKHIYENIIYAELNTKSDYCMKCDYDGEIKVIEDKNGKLVWECPKCGNRDQTTLQVTRRTCGYIGSQFWNQGRTEEIKDRVLHID